MIDSREIFITQLHDACQKKKYEQDSRFEQANSQITWFKHARSFYFGQPALVPI